MSGARRILVLHDQGPVPDDLGRMIEALTEQGATVLLRRCDTGDDGLLDDIAAADCVVSWK